MNTTSSTYNVPKHVAPVAPALPDWALACSAPPAGPAPVQVVDESSDASRPDPDFDSAPPIGFCPKCNGGSWWWDLVGGRHCMNCERERFAKSDRFWRKVARLRRRVPTPSDGGDIIGDGRFRARRHDPRAELQRRKEAAAWFEGWAAKTDKPAVATIFADYAASLREGIGEPDLEESEATP